MKKTLIRAISCFLLLATLMLCVISCTPSATLTIRFENGDDVQTYRVKLADYKEGATLYDVLKNDSRFQAEMDETTTPFLTSLCGVTPDAEKFEYISVYTSITDKSFGDAVFEEESVSYYYAAVGIAELPLVEDTVYIFRLESWS
ncbi:MAG: hypothetical protein E7666_04505 [Ruminococcaceae bacterium]|nr:hypothetical protein [Oscillospiraceae bacterium]